MLKKPEKSRGHLFKNGHFKNVQFSKPAKDFFTKKSF
jgi:hypothetical protein